MGRETPETSIPISITLPLRNQSELEDLLSRIYDPEDPLYGNYLTTKEFIDRFCPTREDYNQVEAYARGQGFAITGVHSNRLLLEVTASARTVESSFNLRMHRFQTRDERDFYAPDNDPEVPDSIASRIVGVIGLDTAAVWHPYHDSRMVQTLTYEPMLIGSGPGGGMSPSDISTAYSLNSYSSKGSGQILGLFELDGYTASDIAAYEKNFSLPSVPLKNVLVGGASGKAGSGANEVTLDIELMAAMAPSAKQIIVYEGPNTSNGVLITYNKIATDNLAKQISTSWGISESQLSNTMMMGENAIFAQMAAQGQTIFAAAGDSGAYDNGTTLSVDDPSSQPFVVGVGGTRLYVNSSGTYKSETTWNGGSVKNGAGGGGISTFWGIPPYQQGISSAASTTMRNIPDVALNADPNSAYSIYYSGKWYLFNGTSCTAPLWAGFTAIVNQKRAAKGGKTLGFANAAFYQIGKSTSYNSDFNDIADHSTNLYYSAVTGYDNATGWGSFKGAGLIAALTDMASSISAPSAPQNLKATPGNTSVSLSWTASALATQYTVHRSTTNASTGFSQIASISTNSHTDSNLTKGKTYYYAVKAVNSAGSSALSTAVAVQLTAPTLAITSGPSVSARRTSAIVSWSTNLSSSSVVAYGTNSGSLKQTVSQSSMGTAHALSLSKLLPKTTYYYRVSSSAGGATVSSTVSSFTTLK
jgi:kumamolisin